MRCQKQAVCGRQLEEPVCKLVEVDVSYWVADHSTACQSELCILELDRWEQGLLTHLFTTSAFRVYVDARSDNFKFLQPYGK